MPCRYDEREPNLRELESKKVASLIKSLFTKLNKVIPPTVTIAAKERSDDGYMAYGLVDKLDYHTNLLCSAIKSFQQKEIDIYLYNGRDKDARKLADWWDNHVKQDKIREKIEEKRQEIERLKKSGLSKLTKEEREALKLYD